MTFPTDNENWAIEIGDMIIQKRACGGMASLSPWEKLVYCLWVADYGMRNAGELETAAEVYADFHSEARRVAAELCLRRAQEAFSLDPADLAHEYFDRFESICDEVKHAAPSGEFNWP